MPHRIKLYSEWAEKGEHDLETATLLHNENHYTDIVAFHIHQAVEKYLKAYLLFNGWKLEKTHDLIKLKAELEKYGLDLSDYELQVEKINEFYIESRYPLSSVTDYSRAEITESLSAAQDIIKEIVNRVIY